uniref:Uncharacterized protein n=1 Tax=Lates calcarifer TaxID=8187 RepID=A0A4W6BT69_LATCA
MAELDLSLSDALTDSAPQSGPESLVERDFVAQLEAEAFDDQVGETVGKTDYIPLLDNDDTRAGEVMGEKMRSEAGFVQGCDSINNFLPTSLPFTRLAVLPEQLSKEKHRQVKK